MSFPFYKPPNFYYPVSITLTVIGGTVLLREIFIVGAPFKGKERLDGRTVIITGANSGVGKGTAESLAERGARVILACRNIEDGKKVREELIKKTRNTEIALRKLDLSSMKSIKNFADLINEKEKRVDILINNAGVMRLPKRELTSDGFEQQLGVNYLGHFYLTQLLLDKLKESSSRKHCSRVVNVTCKNHMVGKIDYENLNSEEKYDPGEAYYQSKLALVLFSIALHKRLKGTGVNVYTVDPGLTRSNLGRHLEMRTFFLSRWIVEPTLKLFQKSPIQASHNTTYAAVGQDLEKKGGTYIFHGDVIEAVNVDTMKNKGKEASRLWLVSEKWIESRLSEPQPLVKKE